MTRRTGSAREAAKAERRRQLLSSAKHLFARYGFRAVRLGDIGQGAGVSGPAVYRHFDSKEAVLTELLVGISEYLHTGGERIIAAGEPPHRTLSDLIDFHVDFALTEPELIRIQDRDLDSLPDAERRSVRRLQRQYVTAWAGVVRSSGPHLSEQEATVRVHALFGMVNSTPHLSRRLPAEVVATQLRAAARSALVCMDTRGTDVRGTTAQGVDAPGTTVRVVILTGGRSRRFGGVHKPGVTVGGLPVLARVLGSVRAFDPTAEVWVAGPLDGLDDADRAAVHPIVESPRFGGPLAGIAAALADMDASESTVLLLAGDVPHLDPGDLGRLVAASSRAGRAACGEDASGRLQPLLAAWPEALLRERLHHIGDATDRSVRLLWDRTEPVRVPMSAASTEDFDTPNDYRRITGDAPPPQRDAPPPQL